MELTKKQQEFVINKAAGVKNKEAAIAAGYSAKTADTIAARMMGLAHIKKAIAKAKRDMRAGVTAKPDVHEDDLDTEAKKRRMPKAKYHDPIAFLEDVMNHKYLPVAMRADAAKQLLPYKHARIGEKGKKESAKERAGEIARGRGRPPGSTNKPKFATKAPPPPAPPPLRAIQGGKV